jgi:uncharacterized membrane protein YkoI
MKAKVILFSLLAVSAAGPLRVQGGTVGPTTPETVYSTEEFDKVRRLRQSGDILSLEAILARARGNHGGRVLEIELETVGERYVYEVQLVDDKGQIQELWFDAMTGELIMAPREK